MAGRGRERRGPAHEDSRIPGVRDRGHCSLGCQRLSDKSTKIAVNLPSFDLNLTVNTVCLSSRGPGKARPGPARKSDVRETQ